MKAILMLVLGLVLGLFGSWMLLRSTQPGQLPVGELIPPKEEHREKLQEELRPAAPRESVAAGERSSRQDVSEKLFSRPLLEHHEREFLGGWRSVRPEGPDDVALRGGEGRFRTDVLASSAAIGRAMAEEADDLDRTTVGLAESQGLVLLELLTEDIWAPEEADLAGDLLGRCVEVHPVGPLTDGTTFAGDRDAFVEPGMTISFGPGIHELDERRLRGEDGGVFPSDVTIIGAGKDATLLRIGDISIRGDVERLAFRDLTIDAQNDGMFDMRTGKGLLDFLRVRIVRFDAGHGGCYVFSVRGGLMLRAEQCDFIGGYSRSGSGRLFRDQPKIARFTDCRFELIDVSALRYPGGHLLFNRCGFLLEGTNPMEWKRDGLYFRGCTFEQIPAETPREELQKDLGDLFYGA